VKETQQNGGTTNSNAGEASSLSMSMVTTFNLNCITGNAVFTLNNASPASYFPMTYTLGYDSNGNGQFTAEDTYINGSDSTSPKIEFYNLSLGSYNIIIEPASGCNYQFFNFSVGPCITMDIKLKNFTGNNFGKYNRFSIEIETDNDLKTLKLESSLDGRTYGQAVNIPFEQKKGIQFIQFNQDLTGTQFFRLAMTDNNGKTQYSKVINLVKTTENYDIKIAPNPFTDYIGLSEYSNREDIIYVNIVSASGQILVSERFNLRTGQNNFRMLTSKIPKGIYMIQMKKQLNGETQIARIIKN
jgi:hypothetical protein